MSDKPKFGKDPLTFHNRSEKSRLANKLLEYSSGEKSVYTCVESEYNGNWYATRTWTECPKCKHKFWAGSKGVPIRENEFECVEKAFDMVRSNKDLHVQITDHDEPNF
jgi:hypothetical protein